MWREMKGLAGMAALCFLLSAVPAAAQAAKRLILTDGSYQIATEWKRTGDRVSYLSAERGEWEELPASLIDWKATEEWNSARAKSQQEELKQVTEEEVAARKEAMLNTPLVAPDLRLPAEGGVFVLEEHAGKPELTRIAGSKIEVDEHTGKNLLKRSILPIASQVATLELSGASAKVRLHTATPSIFVDVENSAGVIPGDNFRVVRLERKGSQRVVAKQKTSIAGEQATSQHFLHTRAEKFSGDWWRVRMIEDLTPGEYAIVLDVPGDELNPVVWDFGVEK